MPSKASFSTSGGGGGALLPAWGAFDELAEHFRLTLDSRSESRFIEEVPESVFVGDRTSPFWKNVHAISLHLSLFTRQSFATVRTRTRVPCLHVPFTSCYHSLYLGATSFTFTMHVVREGYLILVVTFGIADFAMQNRFLHFLGNVWAYWHQNKRKENTFTEPQCKKIRECLLTRLPHLKCISLGFVRSSHLQYKMHYVGYVHSSLPTLMYVGSIATPKK